jgi:hypothetical protein
VELDNKYAGPQTEESKAYFQPIIDTKPEHFAWFLYNRDISDFNPREVPVTDCLREQAVMGSNSVEQWLRRVLETGELDDTHKFNEWMVKSSLHLSYKLEMEGGHHKVESNSWFYRKLEKMNDILELETRKFKPPGDYQRPENCVRIKTKQEDAVKQWNKLRGDNVVIKKVKVVECKASEVPDEVQAQVTKDNNIDDL